MGPLSQKVVLIVEDEPDNREIMRITMEEMVGARTALAGDGEEALHRVVEIKPSLILLDLMMPKLDGLRRIRRREGSR